MGGYWWSSTENGKLYAFYQGMTYDGSYFYHGYFYIENGYSVRCLRDN
jgi:hypothetical protein